MEINRLTRFHAHNRIPDLLMLLGKADREETK